MSLKIIMGITINTLRIRKFILVGEELDIYDEFQYIMKYRITKTNRRSKDFINQIKPLLDAEKVLYHVENSLVR